jgi:hypothetical protein
VTNCDSSLSEAWSAGSVDIDKRMCWGCDLHSRYGLESLQKGQIRRHGWGTAGAEKMNCILSIENGLVVVS